MRQWKAIPGFSNYECSRCGVFRSLARTGRKGRSDNYLYAGQYINTGIYSGSKKMTLISDDGSKTTMTRQRAMYMTWVGEIPDGFGVTMIDGDKDNINPDNLTLVHTGYSGAKPKKAKESIYRLEGFSAIMQRVISMPLRCNPQWVYPWQ